MIASGADLVRQTGLWLGWLGAALLGVTLVLMIRETFLARLFGGLERMYGWHHRIGTTAYLLLLAHPLALGGAVMLHDPAAAWGVIAPAGHFPASALGWLGTLGLMAGLGVTLLWPGLNYGRWRVLHAWLGLAALLGFAHVFAYRGISAGTVLLAAPAVAALSWRALRADRGGAALPYEVSAVIPLPSTTEVVLRPLAARIPITPGQFVMAAFFRGARFRGCGEFHPYTVCGSQPDGTLVLAIKALGDCTRHLQSLEPGVAARVQGPFGTFLQNHDARSSLWIAGGVGITPFLAALRAGELRQRTDLLYTYRSAGDALYLQELLARAAVDPDLHFQGLELQEDLQPLFTALRAVDGLASRAAFVCGPPPMIRAVIAELARLGMPLSQIHFEKFDFRS